MILSTSRCSVLVGVMLLQGGFARTTQRSISNKQAIGVSQPSFDGPAELPRAYVRSSLADTPAPGKTWKVRSSDDLQAILNRAGCGETIAIEAGTEFTGRVTLPAKNCDDDHWIIIRTSAPDAALPSQGTRITPCYAGVASLPGRPALNCVSTQKVMAKFIAVRAGGPFILASGANHYRLGPGLEITRPVGTGVNYNLIGPDTASPADHIIVDRDWVHGTAQDDTTRGIYLSGITYAAVIDSYLNDFHCIAGIGACVDSQAIAGGLGNLPQGTWKITNNFLEAAAENILFGGGSGTTIPTDIEIRHNHMFKPLAWMAGQPGFIGGLETATLKCPRLDPTGIGQCPFVVKNLFELKNAQRLLFEGNVLEYTWPGFTQHGIAIVLTALSQGGIKGNPNATVADITLRYNQISHAASGVVIAEAAYESGPPKLEARISIHDDVFDDLSPTYYNGDTSVVAGMAFQLSFCSTCTPLQDILITHVTMLLTSPRMFMVLGAPVGTHIQNLTFTNNIVSSPPGLTITGTGAGAPCAFSGATNLARLNSCIGPYSFIANALIGATTIWPTGNLYPHTGADVGFAKYSKGNSGNYNLLPRTSYTNIGTDGTNLGAAVDAINQATSGVQ
jgi:hypothetical protein